MALNELRARAAARAAELPRPAEGAAEAWRADAMAFFARVPEPPVYRRRDDPVRRLAKELAVEGEGLLARGLQLGDATGPWVAALERHLEALLSIGEGRVEAAEVAWRQAVAEERAATAPRRLWSRTDERPLPVFDRQARVSRYDPRAESQLQVRVPCPLCRKVGDFSFSPRHATHAFRCLHCARPFTAYFAELRSLEVARAHRRREYTFRLEELSGDATRVVVEDSGTAGELAAARRDLMGFLYAPETALRGVLNLQSSRVLWLSSRGACFVATVAFGHGAPELAVLREFRDGTLAASRPGRRAIAWYYRHGPALAKVVQRSRTLKAATRLTLAMLVKALTKGAG